MDMLKSARERFVADLGADTSSVEIVELAELTLRNLRGGRDEVDRADFLARADTLAAVGKTALISDYFEFHRLAAYVATHTKQRTAFVVGAGTLAEIFDENMYSGLQGGTLEAMGRLFRAGLTLYVYPLLDATTGKLTTVQNFEVRPRLRGLYDYLVACGSIRQLENHTPEYLPIFSRDVLAKIARGDSSWEAMVPAGVAATIRARGAFGWRPGHDRSAA